MLHEHRKHQMKSELDSQLCCTKRCESFHWFSIPRWRAPHSTECQVRVMWKMVGGTFMVKYHKKKKKRKKTGTLVTTGGGGGGRGHQWHTAMITSWCWMKLDVPELELWYHGILGAVLCEGPLSWVSACLGACMMRVRGCSWLATCSVPLCASAGAFVARILWWHWYGLSVRVSFLQNLCLYFFLLLVLLCMCQEYECKCTRSWRTRMWVSVHVWGRLFWSVRDLVVQSTVRVICSLLAY